MIRNSKLGKPELFIQSQTSNQLFTADKIERDCLMDIDIEPPLMRIIENS